jgi:hypothetical protein
MRERSADGPEGKTGKLQMRPCEGQTDDRNGERDRGEHMTDGKPPAGEQKPDDVAQNAQWAGADILAVKPCASVGLSAERPERVNAVVKRCARPRNANDGDDHEKRRNKPADRGKRASEDEP